MSNKILKILKKIKIEHIFLFYIFVQPFIDIYLTFNKHPFQIAGLAINALINFAFVFGVVLYYVVKVIKNKRIDLIKKDLIILIVYVGVFLIYSVLHYLNMQQFDDDIFNRHAYGYIKETYFIFRCFVLPLIFLYTLYRLKISKEKIILAIKVSIFIICFVIIGTNIFGVSLASYAEHGKLIYIDGSIFHWPFFNGSDDFDLYTSKGWFHSANELSAILIAFSPLIVYSAFMPENKNEKESVFDVVLLLVLIITINMLGTRTASLGFALVLVCVFLLFIFFKIIKKINIDFKKFIFKFSIFSLIFTVLFFISPFYNNRYGEYKSVFKERPLKEKLKKKHKATDKSFAKFVEDNAWYFFIEPQLLDIYPVNNDKEFWQYIITRDLRLNTNYRIIKTDIYNRIFERNDNKFDYALGIGYNDVLTTERDYAMQVYYFGVVGVLILIGPFILSILYCCYRVLRYQQKFFKLDVLIVLMGNFIGIMVPYLTGHVFGIVFPMTYIVLNTLLILTMVRDDEKFVIEKEKAN